jgi:hypothetical protein
MAKADASLLDRRTTRGAYGEQPPSSFHIYMWTIGAELSPFEVAAQFEHPELVELLRGLATPRQRFLIACALGDAADANSILATQPGLVGSLDTEDRRLLPDAGWKGNERAVELMLTLGFDIDAEGQDCGTVLHCAAWQGAVRCVEVILRHPGSQGLIDCRDPTHQGTPLGWCCHGSQNSGAGHGDHAAVARLLLEAGAQPVVREGDATPAVHAVIREFMRG